MVRCLFLHWIEVNPMVEGVRLPILFNEPSGTDLVIAVVLTCKHSIQGIPPSVGTFPVPIMGYDNGSVFVFTLD